MDRPLKILMILHMPWSRDLGAPRVSVEVADEFIKMGHLVDKFDINDAFPRRNHLTPFYEQILFAHQAIAFVRKHGHKYDIIQAEHGNLPTSKSKLNYTGLLVSRSNGLAHFYEAFAQESARLKRQRGVREGSVTGNTLRGLTARMANVVRNAERSFDAADILSMNNRDEWEYVTARLGYHDKAIVVHNGLSEERFEQFADHRTAPFQRLAAQQISFIGNWSDRKGARDFPRLVRLVRQARPAVKFLLLGTGKDEASIRSQFDPVDRADIAVVPSYTSAELPVLLSGASVGLLPCYIEGFGIAVLEQCAAGIPTLAYDVPGPREMLRYFDPPLLTPPGDVEAAAQRLVTMLSLSEADYTALSLRAAEIAERFRWSRIALDLLSHYERKLAELAKEI